MGGGVIRTRIRQPKDIKDLDQIPHAHAQTVAEFDLDDICTQPVADAFLGSEMLLLLVPSPGLLQVVDVDDVGIIGPGRCEYIVSCISDLQGRGLHNAPASYQHFVAMVNACVARSVGAIVALGFDAKPPAGTNSNTRGLQSSL